LSRPAQLAPELPGRRVVARVLQRVEQLEGQREVVGPLVNELPELLHPAGHALLVLEQLGEHAGVDRLEAERVVELAQLHRRLHPGEEPAVEPVGHGALAEHGPPERHLPLHGGHGVEEQGGEA
jgi:hypothetical protein